MVSTSLSRDQEVLNSLLRQLMAEQQVVSISTMFEDFSATTLMRDYDVSLDELARAKTDGGNDGGIDYAFLLTNGVMVEEDSNVSQLARDATVEVILLSCTSKRAFEAVQLQKIRDTVEDLVGFTRITPAFRRRYNPAILRFFQMFRTSYMTSTPRKIQFRIIYAANARSATGVLQDLASEIEDSVRESFSAADVTFQFAGAADLYRQHQEPARFDRDLEYDGQVITTAGAYVCLVPLPSFAKFINHDGHLLAGMLESNVRDYQGNIEVNRGIRETLASKSETEFWWLNNGITILTSSASILSGKLHLERPQIVNGLQTTFEIFSSVDPADESESRHLLVKIVQTSDEPLRDQIIRATNSQTAIPAASLWATDDLQKQIET